RTCCGRTRTGGGDSGWRPALAPNPDNDLTRRTRMTDPQDESTGSEPRQRWLEDIQDALERNGDAIRTAWDATRESRASVLESAKQAAEELGEALDKGIAAARERWKGEEGNAPDPDG